MCTYHIKVHIGFEEIVEALIYQHVTFGDPLTPKRQEAMKLALSFVENYGNYGWSLVEFEANERYGAEVRVHVSKIFPEFV